VRASILIPDDLYAETEQIARRKKRSRSEVVRDALREYLARHDAETIIDALNRVADVEDSAPDIAVAGASAAMLKQVEW
jgi:metal-responsive CopG/Arc/MetJ family transcriptional regulator